MEIDELTELVLSGNRRALARAITLVESRRDDHRSAAETMQARLRDANRRALRIGLTGTPGVGKSTFIEAFGLHLTALGLRVAVLAVDPSSARTGGSILGDKTRMPLLSRDKNAYIRPSPSNSALGGVAEQTRAVIEVCEAAAFDVILVETVGVGQSETLVAAMTDIFTLLIAPAGGDELQGVKRGIMELADLVLVNKADGDLKAQATRTAADYAGALRLMRASPDNPADYPKVLTMSATEGTGLDAAWAAMRDLADWRDEAGITTARRARQRMDAFATASNRAMTEYLETAPDLAALRARIETEVASGRQSPESAARAFIAAVFAGV